MAQMIYPIFTAMQGEISEGARVDIFNLKTADVSIPTIIVGETGRGRDLGILPVENVSLDEAEAGIDISAAQIGQSHSGKPKLFAADTPDCTEKAIVVFRTDIGFRGGNDHTGDLTGWRCANYLCGKAEDELPMPETCPGCGKKKASNEMWGKGMMNRYAEFPGEILITGIIAQGGAGRMGSGSQLIALIPRGVVFRTSYTGRLYGNPAAHYMEFDGKTIISMTRKERDLVGLPSDNGSV